MEYGYSDLHIDASSDDLGGRVDFTRLPNGRWIVGRWYIRMPMLTKRRVPTNPLSSAAADWRTELASIREESGEVVDVSPPSARRPRSRRSRQRSVPAPPRTTRPQC